MIATLASPWFPAVVIGLGLLVGLAVRAALGGDADRLTADTRGPSPAHPAHHAARPDRALTGVDQWRACPRHTAAPGLPRDGEPLTPLEWLAVAVMEAQFTGRADVPEQRRKDT